MVSKIILYASLFALAASKPLSRRFTVHESRNGVPSTFVHEGPAHTDSVLKLRIALVQGNSTGLIDTLYEVSTPGRPSYGQHLSKEEVEEYMKPRPDAIAAVNTWLQNAGVNVANVSPAGDFLTLSIPVHSANQLLNTEFSVYTHTPTGKQVIRTTKYSLPHGLAAHIDFVHPTISFEDPRSRLTVSPSVDHEPQSFTACLSSTVNPACVLSRYAIPRELATQQSNGLGVSGFLEQFANQADLTTFLQQFRPDITSDAATHFLLEHIDGGQNPQDGSQAGLEANLDIQYTVGIAAGVPTTFISVGGDNHDSFGGFLDITGFLLAKSDPPHALTTSYGSDESGIPDSLANRLCDQYAALGVRGTSVIFASGDGGVSGAQSNSCSQFVPTFPSGCPYVTSVGATEGPSPGVEVAASFSSGGFSNIFGMPSYQAAAVNSYLSSIGSTNSGKFNPSGRAFPDVSAIGVNVGIIVNGGLTSVEGTSCSSPIFASIIALLNDELVARGRNPLGFLNPFLYANPQAFNDITSGSNPGCGTNGFDALSGWDPVTGLGTPNFASLKAAAGL